MSSHAVVLSRAVIGVRTQYTGRGILKGTVLDNQGAPLSRRVFLFAAQAGDGASTFGALKAIGAAWSDPADGSWRFERLSPESRYAVITYDHAGQFDPVIKGGLIPEPME